jgi:hypothetical protein
LTEESLETDPWKLAAEYTSSFDTLLDAYAKIAEALPRFDRYSITFPEADFQNVLALVYVDIIEFHRRAYKFFRRRGLYSVVIFTSR